MSIEWGDNVLNALMVILVLVLAVAILGLTLYNIRIRKKLQEFRSLNDKITGLNVLQDFMNTIGEYSTVDQKIQKINDILIEHYDIKYSTIVIFNGTEYEIKASNVEEKHWDALKNLHEAEIFADSISTAMPKYVTVNNEGERLPYQKMEFGRAKSAIFFPLYIDNVYIGYWIIESGIISAFDNTDTTVLEVVKDNIVSVFKTVEYQNIVENIVRVDKFSELYSAEYLYGKGKEIIDKYTTSTVAMFRIINIEEINEKFGRKTGNEIIINVSKKIKENISSQYIFVRYMGPKFVIVFSGIDIDGVANFIEEIKEKVEEEFIEYEVKKGKSKGKILHVKPKLNFVLSTYYKGTALDNVTKKLEEYLDNTDEDESDINNI